VSAAEIDRGEDRARRKRHADFTFGLILIAFGLLFLGERINVLPMLDFRRLWPVAIVIVGLAQLIMPREDRSRFGGLSVVFVGCIFLMHTYHVLMLRDSWPLFIVLGGLSLILGRRS